MDRPPLKLAPVDNKAATYAVMHWHYSQRMPVGRVVRYGVWEGPQYVGCVLFARGASPNLGKAYRLSQTQLCELVRVALTDHEWPVTAIVSRALKLLHKSNPGLRLVVSFADPFEGHVGTIYQGGNWIYTGQTTPMPQYWINGRWAHQREATGGAFGGKRQHGNPKDLSQRMGSAKYRYLYPLDEQMREQVEQLRKPYPKKQSGESETGDTTANHAVEGRSTLTSPHFDSEPDR